MNAFKATREQWTAAKLAYRQGGFKRWQRPFGGTIGFTYPLMRMGAEVWVTTTRPYLSLDTVMADTKEWLARQHIPYDYMIFDDDKYKTLYDQVDPHRVVAVIDDLSVYLKAAARLFGLDVPIQVATMYNRDDPALGIDRMMLPETSWCMRRRIKKWYDDNA